MEPQCAQSLIVISARNCDIPVSGKRSCNKSPVHLYLNRAIKKEFARFKEVTVGTDFQVTSRQNCSSCWSS